MAENEADDKENERQAEQVDMGNTDQRIQVRAGILGNHFLDVLEPI